MEFKTSELEATLNRKEQMISKLQKDLEEVTVPCLAFLSFPLHCSTVEPRYNDIPDVTFNYFHPGQRYSKMYAKKPRLNDLRYNDSPNNNNHNLAAQT